MTSNDILENILLDAEWLVKIRGNQSSQAEKANGLLRATLSVLDDKKL